MTAWAALAGAILLEVAATLALRASEGFRKKSWLLPVILGYTASFSMLSWSLSLGMPVGIAYGVWSACGVALVAVLARFLFAEPLTPMMIVGITFIVAGVLTIEILGAAPLAGD
ncbi:MAG: multidrug efflux SMR transporter [Mycobacterium sp.]